MYHIALKLSASRVYILFFITFVENINSMSERKRTEIAELGEFGLIDSLTVGFESKCKTTLRGVGDDAAVIKAGRDDVTLPSCPPINVT